MVFIGKINSYLSLDGANLYILFYNYAKFLTQIVVKKMKTVEECRLKPHFCIAM